MYEWFYESYAKMGGLEVTKLVGCTCEVSGSELLTKACTRRFEGDEKKLIHLPVGGHLPRSIQL